MSKELEELKLWQREIKETEIEELTHSDKEIGDLIIIILENLEKAVFTNVSKHEGIAHELRVMPQGEPSLSELLEENKRLKDSIEKYKQMVTQILFIMKNQSERNSETQTV